MRYYRQELEFLTPDYVCSFGPGRGMEEDGGYRLLMEKVRVAAPQKSPRLFCAMYTYSAMRELVVTQAMSWGYKCDGFLAFSNESVPELGIIRLEHEGEEAYNNMWQKVRSIWTYIHQHYQDDYDYFHLGGDDMYVLVENMRQFLSTLPDRHQPRHMGQLIPSKHMISGGPGYTLNAAALKQLVQEGLPVCAVNTKEQYEDRLVSQCFRRLGLPANNTDTRDVMGEQRYHNENPAQLYSVWAGVGRSYQSRNAAEWAQLAPPPGSNLSSVIVGPKNQLEAVARHSVSFHRLSNPQYVARVHAILFPDTCPLSSPLGMGLQQHGR